eukprot:TRINITY_DN197_c2_g1_i3.p1 TRINITY_DN197_c2_g1~~TRINITY_DN197_c2_g1_i3.p1  ORF type:complete len:194 (+),score=-25.58 TRINITY_DN197_c2_g1_i3:310-891(+)
MINISACIYIEIHTLNNNIHKILSKSKLDCNKQYKPNCNQQQKRFFYQLYVQNIKFSIPPCFSKSLQTYDTKFFNKHINLFTTGLIFSQPQQFNKILSKNIQILLECPGFWHYFWYSSEFLSKFPKIKYILIHIYNYMYSHYYIQVQVYILVFYIEVSYLQQNQILQYCNEHIIIIQQSKTSSIYQSPTQQQV